ncbi:MAG: hypothetical protein U0936_13090 [Planctomycetaceae bacterium]
MSVSDKVIRDGLPSPKSAQYDGILLPFFNITRKLFRRIRSCSQLLGWNRLCSIESSDDSKSNCCVLLAGSARGGTSWALKVLDSSCGLW